MRVAYRVLSVGTLGLLAGCVTAQPQQTVVLSKTQSAFEAPLDGKWRKGHDTRPVAILAGRAETTSILMPRRAALEASCPRGKPRLRLAYDIGLRSGPIDVAYRFDDKAEQKGRVLVRGQRRNFVAIDYAPTATAFMAELGSASALSMRASRGALEMHDAHFRWDPNDAVLRSVLAACQVAAPAAARASEPSADDDDDALDGAIKDVL